MDELTQYEFDLCVGNPITSIPPQVYDNLYLATLTLREADTSFFNNGNHHAFYSQLNHEVQNNPEVIKFGLKKLPPQWVLPYVAPRAIMPILKEVFAEAYQKDPSGSYHVFSSHFENFADLLTPHKEQFLWVHRNLIINSLVNHPDFLFPTHERD
jgi:hypothetical protein